MNFLLPVVAALVALLVLPGWSFYFEVTPKVVITLLGAGAALAWFRWPTERRARWFIGMVAVQALGIVLATMFSTNRWMSFYGSTWRRSGMLVELAVLALAVAGAGQFGDPQRLRDWLRITIAASIPISVYAVFQYFGVDPVFPSNAYHFGEGRFMIVRPPSTLGHAAYLATYLLYVIFGGIALARREISRVWKWIAFVSASLAMFAMILSGTRAALVGFLVGLVFVAVRDRTNRNWLVVGGMTIFLLGAFYFSPFGEKLRARAFWSSEDAGGGARLMLWRDTLHMSSQHLGLGYGPETFSREFPRHQSLELARAFPDFYHESPHNIFLDALVSRGLTGMVPLLILAAIGLVARDWLGGGFIAMLVSQQFTAFTVPTELFFYLCLAMSMREVRPGPGSVTPKPRNWPVYWSAIRLLAIPFTCFAVYLEVGDWRLASARRALDRGDLPEAGRMVTAARQWNASADVYFSRRLASQAPAGPVEPLRVWQYAMEAAVRAPQTADDPQNALVNLAALQAAVNDADGVERSLRQAIAVAPNWYKAHWLLAQVLDREGRLVEAREEARLAFDRDGGKHPEVKQTWDQLHAR